MAKWLFLLLAVRAVAQEQNLARLESMSVSEVHQWMNGIGLVVGNADSAAAGIDGHALAGLHRYRQSDLRLYKETVRETLGDVGLSRLSDVLRFEAHFQQLLGGEAQTPVTQRHATGQRALASHITANHTVEPGSESALSDSDFFPARYSVAIAFLAIALLSKGVCRLIMTLIVWFVGRSRAAARDLQEKAAASVRRASGTGVVVENRDGMDGVWDKSSPPWTEWSHHPAIRAQFSNGFQYVVASSAVTAAFFYCQFPSTEDSVGVDIIPVVGKLLQCCIAAAVGYAVFQVFHIVQAFMSSKAANTASRVDDTLVPAVFSLLRGAWLTLVTVVIMGSFGMDRLLVLGLMAIPGILVSYSSLLWVKDVIGAFVILNGGKFLIGDWVIFKDPNSFEAINGRVKDITTRNTIIQLWNGTSVHVCNSKFVAMTINNMTQTNGFLVQLKWIVAPGQPNAVVQSMVTELEAHLGTRTDIKQPKPGVPSASPRCGVQSLSSLGPEIELHCYVKKGPEQMRLRQGSDQMSW